MNLAWAALCKSRGVPESETDQISWSLYCRGALEGAVFDYELQDFSAAYAWPEQQIAMIFPTNLLHFGELTYEEFAAYMYREAERKAELLENGWIVVRIDPDSPTIEDQLERIAKFVLASTVDAIQERESDV
jgi:hypothetical protein